MYSFFNNHTSIQITALPAIRNDIRKLVGYTSGDL